MKNFNINDGIKEFTINNDENRVLRINTSDLQISVRLKQCEKELNQISKEFQKFDETMTVEDSIEAIDKYDKKVKQRLDYIFNTNVSEVVFGGMNCLSICGGKPVFQNFLDEVMPEISQNIEEEVKKSQQNIKKYTSQVKK